MTGLRFHRYSTRQLVTAFVRCDPVDEGVADVAEAAAPEPAETST